VLLLTDRVDDRYLGHLAEFGGKKSVVKDNLDLGSVAEPENILTSN
jgi:hypothetical protein